MPIYEYGCSECGRHIEAFQKISDEPLAVCPDCGGELSKLVSNTSFVLKGSGWYADGYSSTAKPSGTSDKADKKNAPAPKVSSTTESK